MRLLQYNGFLLAALLLLGGCGLFSDDPDDDPFDVVVTESVPIEFTIDDEQLCPAGEDCDAEPGPSPGDIDGPEFQIPVDLDIIELTENPELTEISGRIKKVEIESVEYEVVENTLNVPTPPLEIHMGPLGTMSRENEEAFFLVQLPAVQAMETPTGTEEVEEAARDQSSELFKGLEFAAIAWGDKNIAEGEMFPPQGAITYKLTMNLKFTANPRDIASAE